MTQQTDVYFTYEELVTEYVQKGYELVEYELILDNLFMSLDKNEKWKEQKRIAEGLYAETKELLDFLYVLLAKEQSKR